MTAKEDNQETNVSANGNMDGNIIVGDGNQITVSNNPKNEDKTSVETHVNVYFDLEKKTGSKQTVKNPQKRKSRFSLNQRKDYLLILSGVIFISTGFLLVFGIIVFTAITKAGLSGAAGADSRNASTSSESLQPQPSSGVETEVTLTSSDCDANIEILNYAGDVILTIIILPHTTQTFRLPSGNYTYNVKYHCPGGLAGTAGMPLPQDYSQSFYQPADGDVKIKSPNQPQFTSPVSLDQLIGIILIIFGAWLFKMFIKSRSQTESI